MSRHLIGLSLTALLLAGAAAPIAMAEDHPPASKDTCFYARDWEDWKSPSPTVIYLRVGASQIFRFDLSQGADALKYSDARLINRHETSAWICSPTDLDLRLTSRSGDTQPLFVKSITRLTPTEIEAIPEQFRP